MTTGNISLIGAPLTSSLEWECISWKPTQKLVFRLQMRIAKAMKEKKYNKVKVLQRLLTRSYLAKSLAVRKVTSNKGAKTPGIDGQIWNTNKQKANAVLSLWHRGYNPQPVRRVYITKSNGKKRPLGIMTMKDRAMQALSLFALEPVVESKADLNSYGFRQYRNCADAIEQCFIALAKKHSSQWILEGDIECCFDRIDHNWLLSNVLMETKLLKKRLKASYLENDTLLNTDEGTIQGAIISPSLTIITLSGLEEYVKYGLKRSDKVHIAVFADDFVVTASSRELLEKHVIPRIETFLKQRGLKLSADKTKITHVEQGFDFLGFNVRKYRDGKLLIKPSKKSVKNFLKEIRYTIVTNPTIKTENLIRLLNPKIRGWTNYFQHVVSKKTFSYVDHQIFKLILNWAKRRHPKKNLKWIKEKYFPELNSRDWVLSARTINPDSTVSNVSLRIAGQVKITRHVKVQAKATAFDPEYQDYFRNRIDKRL